MRTATRNKHKIQGLESLESYKYNRKDRILILNVTEKNNYIIVHFFKITLKKILFSMLCQYLFSHNLHFSLDFRLEGYNIHPTKDTFIKFHKIRSEKIPLS